MLPLNHMYRNPKVFNKMFKNIQSFYFYIGLCFLDIKKKSLSFEAKMTY